MLTFIPDIVIAETQLEKILITRSQFAYPPAMVVDSEGSIHVIWSSDVSKGSSTLLYAKIEQNKSIETKSLSEYAYNPDMAIFDDRIHIIWSDYRSLDANYELYYMQLDKNGNIVVNEKRLTHANDKSDYPSIAIDNEGILHVVWEDWRDSYSRVIGTRPNCTEQSNSSFNLWSFDLYKGEGCEIYESKTLSEIYYAKLDENGNKIIDDKRITFKDSFENGLSFRPRTAIDGTSQLHVIWWDRRDTRIDSANDAELYYTRVDLVGNKLIPDMRVTNAIHDSAWPDLAVDSEGNTHVVWFDNRRNPHVYEIYKTTISNDGKKITNDTRISSIIDNTAAGWPNIAIDEKDNIHVVWSEVWTLSEVEPPLGYKSGIYYTLMNVDGIVEQSPMFVADGGGYSDVIASESRVYVLSSDGTSVVMTTVPEFPLDMIAVTAVGLTAALIAIRLKGNKILYR